MIGHFKIEYVILLLVLNHGVNVGKTLYFTKGIKNILQFYLFGKTIRITFVQSINEIMIESAIKLFKSLPPDKRGYIINQIISVNGLSSPRSLYAKRTDQERYGIPRSGPQLYKRLLFEHLVKQCL